MTEQDVILAARFGTEDLQKEQLKRAEMSLEAEAALEDARVRAALRVAIRLGASVRDMDSLRDALHAAWSPAAEREDRLLDGIMEWHRQEDCCSGVTDPLCNILSLWLLVEEFWLDVIVETQAHARDTFSDPAVVAAHEAETLRRAMRP